MANFTRQEQLNALSQILRGQLNPTKSGGTLDTDQEYFQLQEMASISFLLFPKGIFHLGRRVANRLQQIVTTEVALIEDILVGLDNLGQIGKPFTNTTLLSDANTALLGLDAAASVQGRPEAQRFNRIMDQIAGDVRKNVVSRSNQLVRPREESRNVIKTDFARLKTNHAKLLSITFALRDLIDVYNALDLPAKVASTAFANIRTVLATLEEDFETATEAENIAMSRTLLLSSLTNKAVVTLVDAFSDPSNVKYKSPNDPEPSSLRHTGQAVTCTPAFILTSAAPWDLPFVSSLDFSVDGGAPQSVDLEAVTGPLLIGRNKEPFEIPAGHDLHVSVDANSYNLVTGTSPSRSEIAVDLASPPADRLKFKHLGCAVQIEGLVTDNDPGSGTFTPFDQAFHRSITDLATLQFFVFSTWAPATSIVTCSFFLPSLEVGIGFQNPQHVGDYIVDFSGARFEILEVLNPTDVVIDARGLTYTGGTGTLRGSSNLLGTNIVVSPAYEASVPIPASGLAVLVSPAIKTAAIGAGTRTAADIVSDIEGETGAFLTAQADGAPLNRHVKAIELDGRVVLMPRSRFNPFVQINDKFFLVPDLGPDVHLPAGLDPLPLVSVVTPLQLELGFEMGAQLNTRFDTNDVLSAAELVELILGVTTGIGASVNVETIFAGSSLSTVVATSEAADVTVDFDALGVLVGDLLVIGSGDSTGTFRIGTVSPTLLDLDKAVPFLSSEAGLPYTIIREKVLLASLDTTKSTALEVASAPTVLSLLSGVRYGTSVEFEAVTKQGEKLSFDLAEDDDVLKLPGLSPIEILSVDGTLLTLETTITSNTVGVPFTVRSKMGEEYEVLKKDLVAFTTSRTLLKQNKFDESLDAIDAALTSAVLPGQNFTSSRNNASRLLGDLMGLFTTTPLRFNEHGVTPTPASLNLADILAEFSPPVVKQLDDLIRTFRERKYERSTDLLLSGDLNNFYDTNSETASYGGAMLSAARNVVSDLPNPLSSLEDVEDDLNFATTMAEITDADSDFSDTDGEFEIDDG